MEKMTNWLIFVKNNWSVKENVSSEIWSFRWTRYSKLGSFIRFTLHTLAFLERKFPELAFLPALIAFFLPRLASLTLFLGACRSNGRTISICPLAPCSFFLFFFYCPPGKLFTTGRIMKYYRCRCVLRKSLRNRALRNVIPGRVNGRREWSWIMIVELLLP